MKKLYCLVFLSAGLGIAQAGDLIYKSGFEATALVSGTAINVANTGLILQLTSQSMTEELEVDESGQFVFNSSVPFGVQWSVSIIELPNNPDQQNCQAINNIGIMSTFGASDLQINCDNTPWVWDQMNWNEGGWN